jgi:hypothetical protein
MKYSIEYIYLLLINGASLHFLCFARLFWRTIDFWLYFPISNRLRRCFSKVGCRFGYFDRAFLIRLPNFASNIAKILHIGPNCSVPGPPLTECMHTHILFPCFFTKLPQSIYSFSLKVRIISSFCNIMQWLSKSRDTYSVIFI